MGIRRIDKQSELLQFLVEAALTQQQACVVESVSFTRLAEADDLQHTGEVVTRPDAQSQRGEGFAILIRHWSDDKHRWQIGPQLIFFVRKK